MIDVNDLYTVSAETPLNMGGASFGTIALRYEVRQVVNVRNLASTIGYRILCTHRVGIPNKSAFNLSPSNISSYENYPALIKVQTFFASGAPIPRLIEYSPRTLNATVMTTADLSSSTNSSYSRQHSTGSSTSQTNSYDFNVSAGFFGDVPTGSIGGGYGHSDTTTHDQSDMAGIERGRSRQQTSGESMSIKDWGSYACLDLSRSMPTWLWGQEYPWDIIQFRCCPIDNRVDVPSFVMNRLFDMTKSPALVNPPSQLSLFGVDFTMKATWHVDLPSELAKQTLQLQHSLEYLTASHGLDQDGTTYVRLGAAPASFSVKSPDIDLTLLGLDPIENGNADNGAVIGFSADRFVVPPSNGGPFKVLSGANNLQVTGTGFGGGMTTSFSEGTATLRIHFKITDDLYQYSLFVKHWKIGENGCTLTIVCNGDAANPLIRHVDDVEGAGGENNLLALNLRNKDYASIDYHDYLVLGTNTIDITIKPDAGSTSYQLRAIAIGEV